MKQPKKSPPSSRQREYARLCAQLADPGWISEGYVQDRGAGGGSPAYPWTRKVKGKTVSVALSKEQYEWLKQAIANWRVVQETLRQMQRLSREELFESLPSPRRRKRLSKQVLGLAQASRQDHCRPNLTAPATHPRLTQSKPAQITQKPRCCSEKTLEKYRQNVSYNNARLAATTNAGAITAYTIILPSGATNIYGMFSNVPSTFSLIGNVYLLTQQIDPSGRTTAYTYNTNTGALSSVTDPDGNSITFSYTNVPGVTTGSNEIRQISDAFGHTAKFSYDSDGLLTKITDAAGMTSTFTYEDESGAVLTNLSTPYGNTGFQYGTYTSHTNSDLVYQYNIVSEASGNHQMFLFVFNSGEFGGVPAGYTDSSNVPTNRPTDSPGGGNTLANPMWTGSNPDDQMNLSDSFYWNREQYDNLSSKFIASGATNWNFDFLSTNDYFNARLRNWNDFSSDYVPQLQSDGLSMERQPSPDGATTGKMTWFDYPNKVTSLWNNQAGSSASPSLEIRVLPNSSNWYQMYQTDQWGHRTNVVSTYSTGASVQTRTNRYSYSNTVANAIDLGKIVGPDGVTEWMYTYNPNHQVLTATDALGETTTNVYNSLGQLTSVSRPTGLVTVNVYNSTNRLATTYDYATVGGSPVYFRTNTFTYNGDLMLTKTDERGLTTTYTWDGLERLTQVAYPGGSTIVYTYTNLDLATVVDRLGFTTSYTYDAIRQKSSMTDAMLNTSRYGYCECGALAFITNAMNGITQLFYDNQGRLTTAIYPDSNIVNNAYNAVGQLISQSDDAGTSMFQYNNQGLQVGISNLTGLVTQTLYDINDRITNTVDRNGVFVNSTYDNIARVLIRSYPDGGLERFAYSSAGLVAYTNQLTNVAYVTHYGYDAEGRKTAETNANQKYVLYTYRPPSDLPTLTDQNGIVTGWGYDVYGNVTSKTNAGAQTLAYQYDPDNRPTNRWSLAKTNTGYVYDKLGNLLNVIHPASPSLSFLYDALSRVKSMSDAVGTTTFTYTPAGQLASEQEGAWPSDTVSYTYSSRLRTLLDLQQPNGGDLLQNYAYDAGKRLHTVASPSGTFTYAYGGASNGYVTASSLVGKLTLPNAAYISDGYDVVGRMASTTLYNSAAATLDYMSYLCNQAGQRTNQVRGFGTNNQVAYTYDPIGQVLTDLASEVGSGTPRLNEQLKYAYDPAGNLSIRTNNALIQNFYVNPLNELTNNTSSGTLTAVGTTTSPATNVTVNGTNAGVYGDATFAAPGLPLTTTYTAIAKDVLGRTSTSAVTVNLSASVNFQYDGNGNLRSDGLRSFSYDDENQLIQVLMTNQWMSQFTYDGKMRRRIRKEFASQSSGWVETNEVHYIYDGNLVVQERDVNNLPTASYARGSDLSGSFEGAGGIGGLLARSDATTGQPAFYYCDGNGNVRTLINSSNAIVAKYVYDAFGNTLSKAGSLADANLYRFSGKEAHPTSGLVYYLYRYYDPNLQRWPNRDPLTEMGQTLLAGGCPGCNMVFADDANDYMFLANSSISSIDSWGLHTLADCEQQLRKDIVAAGAPGVKCGLSVAAGGLGGAVVGGVVGVVATPVGGVLAGGACEVLDYFHWKHCTQEVQGHAR